MYTIVIPELMIVDIRPEVTAATVWGPWRDSQPPGRPPKGRAQAVPRPAWSHEPNATRGYGMLLPKARMLIGTQKV